MGNGSDRTFRHTNQVVEERNTSTVREMVPFALTPCGLPDSAHSAKHLANSRVVV